LIEFEMILRKSSPVLRQHTFHVCVAANGAVAVAGLRVRLLNSSDSCGAESAALQSSPFGIL